MSSGREHRGRVSAILVLGIVLVLALLVVLRLAASSRSEGVAQAGDPSGDRDQATGNDQEERRSPAEEDVLSDGSQAQRDAEGQTSPSRQGVGARESVKSPGAWGRILDELGEPIEGADLAWTPLHSPWTDPTISWSSIDWDEVEAATIRCRTDAGGSFRFDGVLPGLDDSASAIWVTSLGHEALSVIVPAGASELVAGAEWKLADAEGISIVVRDAEGALAPDAVVRMHGDPERNLGIEQKQALEYRAFRVFRLSGTTNSAGSLILPSAPLLCEVHAEKDGLLSRSESGLLEGTIELTLGSKIQATGQVFGPAPDPEATFAPFVDCWAMHGDVPIPLRRSTVRADGKWGPMELPLLDVDSYGFWLAGGGWVSQTKTVRRDLVTDRLVLDFHVEAGHRLDVHVEDAAGEPLPNATVGAYWQTDGEWELMNDSTASDGRVRLDGIPAGLLWLFAQKNGYADAELDRYTFDPSDPATTSTHMTLDRAGKIVGRCTHGGEPVRDYSLCYWPVDADSSTLQVVQRSVDGSFEITEAPFGEVLVVAYTDEFPPPEPQRVVVRPGEVAEIELELTSGYSVRGRVVDGLTGEGLHHASVQLKVTYRGADIGSRGAEQPVGPDGTFEIFPVGSGATLVYVRAEGYAGGRRVLQVSGDEPADAQLLPLFPLRNLRVQLVCDEPVDFTQFQARILEYTDPPAAFDTKGFLELGSVTKGAYRLQLLYPDGSSHDLQLEFPPGMDAEVTVPIEWYPSFEVEVVPAEGQAMPDRYWVRVDGQNEKGRYESRSFYAGATGTAVVDRVPPGPALLQVVDPSATVLGRKFVVIQSDPEPKIRVELGAADRQFRVVDPKGEPLPDIRVGVWEADSGLQIETAISDSSGIALVRELGEPRVLLWLDSPEIGSILAGPIDLAREDDPVEVVYEAPCSLRAVLLDGDVPVVGAEVDALVPPDLSVAGKFLTGGDGSVSWSGLGTGLHTVRVWGLACWPATQDVQLAPGDNSITMQVKRRGSLRLELRDASGAPVAGARVALVSRELQAAVGDWIAAELVPGDEATLVSDAEGVVTVHGLPRGTYDWRVVGPESGAVSAGAVLVPPGATGEGLLKID